MTPPPHTPRPPWDLFFTLLPFALALFVFLLFSLSFNLRGVSALSLLFAETSDTFLTSLHTLTPPPQHTTTTPALPPLLSALLRNTLNIPSALPSGHLLSSFAIAATLPVVWSFARSAAGLSGAATATFAFLLIPRITGHALLPGFEAFGLFTCTLATYALFRARSSQLWTYTSPLLLALAIHTTPAAILLLIPWLVLTLSDKGQISTFLLTRGQDPTAPHGHILPSPFPLRLLTILPLTLLFATLLHPNAWTQPSSFFFQYATHPLTLPPPPTLLPGQLIQNTRLPILYPPIRLLISLPAVTAILTLLGIFGESLLGPFLRTRFGLPLRPLLHIRPDPEAAGPEAHETKRWALAFLLFWLTASVLLGSTHTAYIDLLANACPFVAIFAGCTLSRLASATTDLLHTHTSKHSSRLTPVILGTLGLLGFLPAILNSFHSSHPTHEAYSSWLIGHIEGTVDAGLQRYPHGPIPLAVPNTIAALHSKHPHTLALTLPNPTHKRILDRIQYEKLSPPLPPWKPSSQASLHLLIHDDTNPLYYTQAHTFARSFPPHHTHTLRHRTIRLFTIASTHPPSGDPTQPPNTTNP